MLLLLAAFVGTAFTPQAAWASCTGTFTSVYDGSGLSEYNLTGSQNLRIKSGTFAGSIKRIASGARICVDQGATFAPSSVNSLDGTLLNYGISNLPAMNPGSGFNIDNFGRATFTSNVNFNGAVAITNRAGADLIFRQTVHIRSGSTIINGGRIIADGDLNLADGTDFTNNFDVLMKGPFNASGTFANYGRLHTEAFININSTAKATNHCSWIADKGFNNNATSTTRTYGLIFINWDGSSAENLFQNNGAFESGPNAITYGWRFINNNSITGEGRFHFRKPSGVSDDQHTKNQGSFAGSNAANPIIFYDDTPSSGKIFDQQNQTPVNTVRQYFHPPRIDLATPGCSAAIRLILYDPDPPAVTYDFSDAPASYGAPSHQIVQDIYLGAATPDWDGAAFATANADGDDRSGSDDEDGVTLGTIQRGSEQAIDVRATGSGGFLQAWIDYDRNGSFGTGEQIAFNRRDDGQNGDTAAGDGRIRILFTPPKGATSAQTYLRLRWSTLPGLSATAAAPDGEVEDYALTFGLAPEPEGSGGAASSVCAAGTQLVPKPRNAVAQTASGSVTNPAGALEAIANEGTFATLANAAQIGAGGILTLDLTGDPNLLLAAGADLTLSIARDSTDGRVLIELSADGVNWTGIGSYGLGGSQGNDFIDDVLDRLTIEAPAGGARYMRFTGQSGTFWIDGIGYTDACGPPAALTVVKSATTIQAGAFLLPGTDVIYTIAVSNTGYGSVDDGAIFIVDSLPPSLTFYGGAAAGGPLTFSQNGANLGFNAATDVRYSNAVARPTSFAQCGYTPAADYDPAVRHICLHPTGAMVGGPQGTGFNIYFRARLN